MWLTQAYAEVLVRAAVFRPSVRPTDNVHDALFRGRSFRTFNVIDDFQWIKARLGT